MIIGQNIFTIAKLEEDFKLTTTFKGQIYTLEIPVANGRPQCIPHTTQHHHQGCIQRYRFEADWKST